MNDLFSQQTKQLAPLAHRLRPKSLEEFIGQEHLIGPQKFFTQILEGQSVPSLILWGPPGTGKTTLAYLLAQKKNCVFVPLSAVSSGIKEVKEVITQATERLHYHSQKTILFIDEIHRFNKAQQDYLLPHIENGTIIFIGATTENPSFEVISPLLSRCRVLVLNKLTQKNLEQILDRALLYLAHNELCSREGEALAALSHREHFVPMEGATLAPTIEAKEFLCASCEGDARRMLNTLEIATQFIDPGKNNVTLVDIEKALQHKSLPHDKQGEEHYNVISAFIKSMRDSDPDATVYYLARLLEAGENPLYVARRMVIFASEDIGNANPEAVMVAIACMQGYDFIGPAEGWIPLAQCATYLASSPKGNTSYKAYQQARQDVLEHGSLPVPLHLRNAPTQLMKDLGYGKGYQYAHDHKDHQVEQQHLPDKLKNKKYYFPTNPKNS